MSCEVIGHDAPSGVGEDVADEEDVHKPLVTAPSEAELTSVTYLAKTPDLIAGRGSGPEVNATGHLGGIDLEVHHAAIDIDVDDIAFVDRGDGAAVEGFGRDVGHHEAVRGAAEAAVGDEGDFLGESGADNGAGDAQHLAHAGSAAGPFIADHNHVASLDAAFGDGGHGVFLAIEDARGTTMVRALWPESLITQPSGAREPRRICRPPVVFKGLIERADNLLAGRFYSSRSFFGERSAGAGHGGSIHEIAFHQALGDDGDAAGLIDIDRDVLAAGFEIDKQRSAVADGVEVVDVEGHAGFAGHGEQVEHGVGGAAGSGDSGDGIFKGLAGDDVAGPQVVADAVHDDLAAADGRRLPCADPLAGRRRFPWARGRSVP